MLSVPSMKRFNTGIRGFHSGWKGAGATAGKTFSSDLSLVVRRLPGSPVTPQSLGEPHGPSQSALLQVSILKKPPPTVTAPVSPGATTWFSRAHSSSDGLPSALCVSCLCLLRIAPENNS